IVFGPVHRYGTSGQGTEATLKALTAAELRSFHDKFYQPSNATLVVVGDVRTNDVVPLLAKSFASWKTTAAPTREPVPTAPQLTKGQIYLVDKPGAAQSVIEIGWVGVARSTPDYYSLQVLNTILGGSFSSRLNQNLREQHGYAYGAFSAFDMRLSPGAFFAGAAVQTDKTSEALREFFNELNGMRSKPVSEEELARAKNFIALSFPGQFETAGDLSRQIEELIVFKLPDNYFE